MVKDISRAFQCVNIGDTPLIHLPSLSPQYASNIKIWMKWEAENQTGSMKDRIARAMIEDVVARNQDGKIKTIVEASSGNTASSVALYSKLYGFDCAIFVQHKVSQEKEEKARSYGAKVFKAEEGQDYMKAAAEYAKKLGDSAVFLDQYNNPRNPEAHYKETGPEIIEGMEGKRIHQFIAAGSTGGTISGVGKALKEHDERTIVTLADPYYSVLADAFIRSVGRDDIITPTWREDFPCIDESFIEGAGKKSVPGNMDFDVVDQATTVHDRNALLAHGMLLREDGIYVGGSTALNAYAAWEIAGMRAKRHYSEEEYNIVIIGADSGENYDSKLGNEKWMEKAMRRSPLLEHMERMQAEHRL